MVVILILTIFAGCNSTPKSVNQDGKTEVLVLAASSLTDVLEEIAEEYQDANPNVKIIFSFGSSGTLQAQIEEGAPADIFLSAAQKQMNELEEKGLIDKQTRVDILENKVVLIVPSDSTSEIRSFEEAADSSVSMIALGESSVPVGQYAQEIYTHLGLWEMISGKANFGSNVREVLTWVEGGNVDCGVVYATDAATTSSVKVICEAPQGSHKPVIYPGAVLAESSQKEAAKKFLDFLCGYEAKTYFEKAGFKMIP